MSFASKEKRDLNADLAICNVASAGPWSVCSPTGRGTITDDSEGTIVWGPYDCPDIGNNADARFIAEARTGWPHAIERALAAEAEVERLTDNARALFDALTGMIAIVPGVLGADEQAVIDRIRTDIYGEEATE